MEGSQASQLCLSHMKPCEPVRGSGVSIVSFSGSWLGPPAELGRMKSVPGPVNVTCDDYFLCIEIAPLLPGKKFVRIQEAKET